MRVSLARVCCARLAHDADMPVDDACTAALTEAIQAADAMVGEASSITCTAPAPQSPAQCKDILGGNVGDLACAGSKLCAESTPAKLLMLVVSWLLA